jgi:hypothetical protein
LWHVDDQHIHGCRWHTPRHTHTYHFVTDTHLSLSLTPTNI